MLTDPFTWNRRVIAVLLLAAIGVGYLLALDAADASHLLRWFWLGIAFTIVYLLYRIASTLEKLRAEAGANHDGRVVTEPATVI